MSARRLTYARAALALLIAVLAVALATAGSAVADPCGAGWKTCSAPAPGGTGPGGSEKIDVGGGEERGARPGPGEEAEGPGAEEAAVAGEEEAELGGGEEVISSAQGNTDGAVAGAGSKGGTKSGAASLAPLGGESESHPFPIGNYGLDQQVQFGITHPQNLLSSVIQTIIQGIWIVMAYAFNGVMLILHWAFSVDLLAKSMSKVAADLQQMREHIDTPWALAAVAAMALWGIWNGLVRRKSIDTMRGLLTSVLFMVALLVVIGNPLGTLGKVTSLANGASTEMLGSITGGSVSEPQNSVDSTEETLFKTVVLRPWCALQFGDVNYCLSKPAGLNQSVADTWLQGSPDGNWRTSLWKITKGSGDETGNPEPGTGTGTAFGAGPGFGTEAGFVPGEAEEPISKNLGDVHSLSGHPEKVELISGSIGSTMSRLGLLLLIAVGLIGAVCLFCYLAMRLLAAALFVLVLVMFAPAMFFVAALGESGRKSVVAWAGRLLGAAVTKVVFALFLAVIVAASNLVTELNLGFFPTWIVFATFWWAVLLKRKDLLALLSLDTQTAAPGGIDFNGSAGGRTLSELFYARQLMRDAGRGVGAVARGATSAPRAVGRRGRDAVVRRAEGNRVGREEAGRQLAREELEAAGRSALTQRNEEEHEGRVEKSAEVLEREQRLSSRLEELDSQNGQTRARAGVRRPGNKRPEPQSAKRIRDERAQVAEQLDALRTSPDYAWARSTAGSEPREVTDRDVQQWVANRRAELPSAADAPKKRAAWINPKSRKRETEQNQGQDPTTDVDRRHRELLDRAGTDENGRDRSRPVGFKERRKIEDEARDSGRIDDYRKIADERARRHRQELRDGHRTERRRRRNVR